MTANRLVAIGDTAPKEDGLGTGQAQELLNCLVVNVEEEDTRSAAKKEALVT